MPDCSEYKGETVLNGVFILLITSAEAALNVYVVADSFLLTVFNTAVAIAF